ncbi:MAG TPA: BREX system ATP-binding domain-containing protein [Ruminiclostridium sp.]
MNNIESIFVIESLRAGIPTRLSTRILPDLRCNLTEKITEDLSSFDRGNIPNGRILWGQYGQGKTHALTAIEHTALDMNFAVSRVSLSREVSCHNLYNFFGNVAPRIKTPDSTLEGIQHYLNKFQLSDIHKSRILEEGRYVNSLPSIVFEDYFYTEGEEKDKLYGDLTGLRLPTPELGRIHRKSRQSSLQKMNFKKNEHTSAYFGVIADALRLCGFSGWVILIDEVELIGRLGKTARYKAYSNLSWLLNWSGGMKYPIYTVAAAATRLQDDLWYGKKDDDRSIMPELAAKYGDAAIADIQNFFVKAVDTHSLKILPAKEEDLEKLLDKITHLHGDAYTWSPELDSSSLIKQLGSQPVRTYIRAALEYLDLQYLYNQKQFPDTIGLGELPLVQEEENLSMDVE